MVIWSPNDSDIKFGVVAGEICKNIEQEWYDGSNQSKFVEPDWTNGKWVKSDEVSTKLKQFSCTNCNQPANGSAITLRSGKQIQGLGDAQEDEDKDNEVVPDNESGRLDEATQATSEMPAPSDNSKLVSPNTSSENSSPYSPPPPYANRLKPKTKKMEDLDKEILNTFKKMEINIPLLNVVRQIPKYAKFLK